MTDTVPSIREWTTQFIHGDFNTADVPTQFQAGWYDWYEYPVVLYRLLVKFAKLVTKLKPSQKINIDTMFVRFINMGTIDNLIKILDIKTEDLIYSIKVTSFYDHDEYKVFGKNKDGTQFIRGTPLYQSNYISMVTKWFNSVDDTIIDNKKGKKYETEKT